MYSVRLKRDRARDQKLNTPISLARQTLDHQLYLIIVTMNRIKHGRSIERF